MCHSCCSKENVICHERSTKKNLKNMKIYFVKYFKI